MTPAWTIIVPVKDPAHGKTRLTVDGVDRVELARAIALDTIAAASACPRVAQVVVVGRVAPDGLTNVRFIPEGDVRGLDEAVAEGVRSFAGMPRAALLGDLPALRPADLSEALDAAASVDRAVVPDAEGTGSTLVTAAAGIPWRSAFGDGSFGRHLALGCVGLDIPATSTLRRDVDTAAQLSEAERLGLGARTRAIMAS